ncbi:UbiX family flavin prenyltransferase [Elongatibacter sediminis]|uniref:Flavin prenyltransferase UbiX n=1 Tax=Elongatibacter sediminis TaxID=3119006 RepID=A0AAW9RD24_9GAMM
MNQHDESNTSGSAKRPKRIIIGISGASGAIYGIRLLEVLHAMPGVETSVIISNAAKLTIAHETDYKPADVASLADEAPGNSDIAARISSGSHPTNGMIVAPCSMKTLSGIVHSYTDNLITRAADVILKEQRRLILVPRESPLHSGHCELLYKASRLGALIAPPMPAFYNRPQSVDDIVNHTVGRVLDLLDLDSGIVKRWKGLKADT